MKGGELVFVYNADSDLFSKLTDFAHKILSPSTYGCQLCALTHGNFTMKQDWKDFIRQLPLPSRFFYQDEFQKQYRVKEALPAVFLKEKEAINVFLSNQEIASCSTLDELKARILQKLSTYDQHHHSHL